VGVTHEKVCVFYGIVPFQGLQSITDSAIASQALSRFFKESRQINTDPMTNNFPKKSSSEQNINNKAKMLAKELH